MSKDKYSPHWDGSEDKEGETVMNPVAKASETGLPDHILDSHQETLMKAEAIKKNPHIMKHLKPHMGKRAEDLKKISSLDELKAVAKKKSMEE